MQLLLYIASVLIILLLNLFVVFNFLKYRFKQDQTILIILLFCVAYIICIIFTITLLASSPDTTAGTVSIN